MLINFLTEVDLVAIGVEDTVLEEFHGLVGDESPAETETTTPLPVAAHEGPTLAEMCNNEGVQMESEILHFHLVREDMELVLKAIGEEQ